MTRLGQRGGVSYCIARRHCPRCRGSGSARRPWGSAPSRIVTGRHWPRPQRHRVDVVDREGRLEAVEAGAGARLLALVHQALDAG